LSSDEAKHSIPTSHTITAHSSIPDLKLQLFDGTKHQLYTRFKESFKSIFNTAPMEDKQRFLQLQTYVTGDAANHVKHLPIARAVERGGERGGFLPGPGYKRAQFMEIQKKLVPLLSPNFYVRMNNIIKMCTSK